MRALVIGAVVLLILGVGYMVVRQNTAMPSPAPDEAQSRAMSETDTYTVEARNKRAAAMEAMSKEYGKTNDAAQ